MIVSWSREFVFVKPLKTGGTSVEAALSRICSDRDIVTPWFPYWETDTAGYKPVNYKELNDCASDSGEHWGYDKIKTAIERKDKLFWDRCMKLTLIRNPFSVVVSYYYFYFWLRAHPWQILRHDLVLYPERFLRAKFLKSRLRALLRTYSFSRYVTAQSSIGRSAELRACQPSVHDSLDQLKEKFCSYINISNDIEGLLLDVPNNLENFDRVLRLERITHDMSRLCEDLGMAIPLIPRFKTSQKMHSYNYSEYYTPEAKERVMIAYKCIFDVTDYSL